MRRRRFTATAIAALFATCMVVPALAADIDYGKPGTPVKLVVGYQPYYTQAWSGVVMRGKKFYEKYLPKGSEVEFQIGLQGAIIVNNMLAGKQNIGYYGDMPGIVSTTKTEVADVRLVAVLGLAWDQCNAFLVRNDAPQFKNDQEAIRWLDGKTVAVPKGSCTDRFAQATFKKFSIQPKEYLNQNIEVITSNFRAGKLDAAVMWEPTTSRLVGDGLARLIATGKSVQENDGGLLGMRADLIRQRPDVVKAWLEAELDAQLFIADPKKRRSRSCARRRPSGTPPRRCSRASRGSRGAPATPRARASTTPTVQPTTSSWWCPAAPSMSSSPRSARARPSGA